MNFSDKIKFQREQNHLTQKELAELVGVSQRAIAAYESSGTIARISTMRKLAHALNVSYDYLKHDEITDPSYGIEKMDYIDEVNGQLGEKGARDINEILEANRALFAGGELDEEAKDAFYQAVTKAYLSCKMEAKKTFGRNEKNISSPQPRIGRWVFRIQKRHEHCSCLPHKKLPVTRILFFLSIRQSALRGRHRQILPPACLSAAQSSARSPAKSIRFRHGFARP